MKGLFKISLVAAVMAGASVTAQAQKVMTLKECMEYAVSNSTEMRIREADIHDAQVERIRQQGTIMRNDPKKVIYCDTIVLNRLTDKVPGNIIYKK